jgi:hypothetical protein
VAIFDQCYKGLPMGDIGKPIFEVVAEQVRVPLVDVERD